MWGVPYMRVPHLSLDALFHGKSHHGQWMMKPLRAHRAYVALLDDLLAWAPLLAFQLHGHLTVDSS